jgi:hypothetical protein
MALAYLRSRTYSGGVLGLVKLLQKFDKFGFDKPKAPAVLQATVRSEAPKKRPNAPCENCSSTSTVWQPGGAGTAKPFVLRCNQCASVDGIPPASTDESCPNRKGGHDMTGMAGGRPRCQACGWQPGGNVVLAGATFADLKRGRGSFGRFS